ncbi:Ig-like domain-containing protein [Clostridium sp.]|uniref:phage tail tube protein n=1 Tax=Clostridium sp. TaxID=1506 RepID=UPI002617B042|nr:Ig-like domain-containing protein [Clostridium sp.]
MFKSGVFPVYNILFKIGTKGLASQLADMATIADMESFTIKMTGKAETWIPMTTQGWERNLITSKGFSITLKGKRSVGDPGNDYVASVAWQAGLSCSTLCEIDFPDGSKLNFNCVIDVTNPGGDSSEKVTPLEFDLKSDGEPIFTPATPQATIELLSSNPANNATAVPTNITPVLTFNNKISIYSGITLLDTTDGAVVPFTSSFDSTGTILTLTPTVALTASSKYSMVLADVTDMYGQKLANTVINFSC